MMDLSDRLIWLSIGCFIGFVLGYIVRALTDIKEKVEHVDNLVTGEEASPVKRKHRDESGFMRHPLAADIAVLIVVTLTVLASFQTGKVNSNLNELIQCTTKYNIQQGQALKSRDAAVKAGTQSEIHLWGQYGQLYKLAKSDPSKIPAAQEALNKAIKQHRKDLILVQHQRDISPYANPNILKACKENSK